MNAHYLNDLPRSNCQAWHLFPNAGTSPVMRKFLLLVAAVGISTSLPVFAGNVAEPAPAPLKDHCRETLVLFATALKSVLIQHAGLDTRAYNILPGRQDLQDLTLFDVLRAHEAELYRQGSGEATFQLLDASVGRLGLGLPWEMEVPFILDETIARIESDRLALLLSQPAGPYLKDPEKTSSPLEDLDAGILGDTPLAEVIVKLADGQNVVNRTIDVEIQKAIVGAGMNPDRILTVVARRLTLQNYPPALRPLVRLLKASLAEKLSAPLETLSIDARVLRRLKKIENFQTIHDVCANLENIQWPSYSSTKREIEYKLMWLGLEPGKTYDVPEAPLSQAAPVVIKVHDLDIPAHVADKLVEAGYDNVDKLLRGRFGAIRKLMALEEWIDLHRALSQLEI
jgi:hypothetical protein